MRIFGGHGPLDRAIVSIFLIALIVVLLGLLIRTRVAYSRFRMRVYEKKVTEKELEPEMMQRVLERVIAQNDKLHRKPGKTLRP